MKTINKLFLLPIKKGLELLLSIFVLYWLAAGFVQTVEWYQGGREAWKTIASYQQKIEQIQSVGWLNKE